MALEIKQVETIQKISVQERARNKRAFQATRIEDIGLSDKDLVAYSVVESDIEHQKKYTSQNILRGSGTPGETPIGFLPPSPDRTSISMIQKDIKEDVLMIRCLDLRSRGRTMPQISVDLGIGRGEVQRLIDLALRAIADGSTDRAEQVREIENYRLDRMLDRIWPMIDSDSDPDLQAVDRVLRIMERRAKMYGIDNLTESESSDGITRTINFTQIIANNPDSIDLSHRLLELANNTIAASITSGPGVPAHTGQVQDTSAHLTSLFDPDEGDGGDLPAGTGRDATETRQDRTDQ